MRGNVGIIEVGCYAALGESIPCGRWIRGEGGGFELQK